MSNLVLFALYLILVKLGLNIKIAMSLCYGLGVINTFYFNKTWTFTYQGDNKRALLKYALLYLSGYIINLAVLFVLVDVHGFAHQLVQGATILFLAVYFFFASKIIVFNKA